MHKSLGRHSFSLSFLTCRILVDLLSICAIHAPGCLNYGADMVSRQRVTQGEWRLHSQNVNMIWNIFGRAEVDLFASAANTHFPLFFSVTEPSTLGVDVLSHPWFLLVNILHQVLYRIRQEKESVL